MADLELIRWWSWRRQRLDRSCRGIDDCLRSIIGVYSANPQGALSLLARVPRVMPGMVEGAIESRIALRLPAMRRTVWMLHAETAHLAFRATDNAGVVRSLIGRAGITDAEYERLEREILLAAGHPMLVDEIREAIKDAPEKLGPVIQALCAEGKLLRIKPKAVPSNTFTFCATRVWLKKESIDEADPAEALVWLAGDYLKGYGPVSIDDFAWWTGAKPADAETALRAHEPEDVGDGLLMWATDVKAFEGTRPFANRVNLLPAWDAYTMGYATASRARFADPSLLPYLYDKSDNAAPVILIEGGVGGLWDYTLSDRRIEIRLGLFEEPTPRILESIESEAGLIAGYFNARDVTIKRVKIKSAIGEHGSHLKPLAETKKSAPRAKPPEKSSGSTAARPASRNRRAPSR